MKYYFSLQYKMLNRKMIDFGLPLIAVYCIVPVIFVFLSYFLFRKTEIAPYIFGAIALGLVSRLGEVKRNDFLKGLFANPAYFKIRLLENGLVILPFMVFLTIQGFYILPLLVLLCAFSLARFTFEAGFSYTIPTPFGRKPFEFLVGFRKTFILFPVAYILCFVAIYVDNFGLGIFAMLCIGLLSISFYSKPENEYFVWSFSLSAKSFLHLKLKACLLNFTLLSSPIIGGLALSFSDQVVVMVAFYGLCLLYLVAFVLAKYSAFPREMSLSQALLIGLCVVFPPFLLIMIPLFYAQSQQKLKAILV